MKLPPKPDVPKSAGRHHPPAGPRDPRKVVHQPTLDPIRVPEYRYSQQMLDALERAMAYSWQRRPSGPRGP